MWKASRSSICLPGPVATQLGIFIGYHRAGGRGGVLAGLCFMLPAFLILMSLTLLYSTYGSVGLVRDAFYGIGPVVLAIFIVAVWRLGKASLKGKSQIAVALASAALVAYTPIGIATALLLAGCVGIALYHSRVWGLAAGDDVLAPGSVVPDTDRRDGGRGRKDAAIAAPERAGLSTVCLPLRVTLSPSTVSSQQ